MRDGLDAEALQLDLPAARMLEQPGPVAEEHRRDDRQDLVEFAELQAMSGDVGAEHADVALACCLLGRRETGGDVRNVT